MQESQAAQAIRAGTAARQFGNHNASGLAHQNHAYPALAVDQQTHLPPQRARKQSKLTGLLNGVDVFGRKTAVEKPVQRVDLAWLEALQVAFGFRDGELLKLSAGNTCSTPDANSGATPRPVLPGFGFAGRAAFPAVETAS